VKQILFISLIFTLSFTIISFAIDVPPPPIDIDISNSSFEKVDSTSFRVRQLIAPDYPGTYWVDFLWNPDLLNFEPTNVGEETNSYGKHRVAIVDKSGKFYSNPIAAMNDIDTWCGTPSETNPCLLKILPGVYDIGSNTLQMNHFVDIEGSGENVTKIKGNSGTNGVISARNGAEYRFLTVENTGGGSDYSIAIDADQILDLNITNMTIIASGGIQGNIGLESGFRFEAPHHPGVKLMNVTINVSGDAVNYGIYKSGFGPYILELKNVSITTTGGISNYGIFTNGGTRIDGSKIKANIATYNQSGISLGITNTLIDGSVKGFGPTKCAGVYDENFTFYADTCP
jgi:hypothetical protein